MEMSPVAHVAQFRGFAHVQCGSREVQIWMKTILARAWELSRNYLSYSHLPLKVRKNMSSCVLFLSSDLQMNIPLYCMFGYQIVKPDLGSYVRSSPVSNSWNNNFAVINRSVYSHAYGIMTTKDSVLHKYVLDHTRCMARATHDIYTRIVNCETSITSTEMSTLNPSPSGLTVHNSHKKLTILIWSPFWHCSQS